MSLYRRGQIWWGRWRFKGEPAIAESSGTSDKEAAQEWHDRRAAELWRTRRLGERPGTTFAAATLEWIEHVGRHKKSYAFDAMMLREINPLIGDVILNDLTTARLTRLRYELSANKPQKPTQDRSPARVNRFLSVVSAILHFAHKRDWIAAVPAIPKTKEPKGTPRFLTQDQAAALLAELPTHLNRMARFALATGARESNVTQLQWSHVDLGQRIAWIDAEHAKAGHSLPLILNDDAVTVLRECLGGTSGYVFEYEGHPVTGANNHAFTKARMRAGVPWCRWHDLRHTWASWHVMAGTPLEVLQKLGGWADIKIVMRYAHLAPNFAAQWAGNSALQKSKPPSSGELTNEPIQTQPSVVVPLSSERGTLHEIDETTGRGKRSCNS